MTLKLVHAKSERAGLAHSSIHKTCCIKANNFEVKFNNDFTLQIPDLSLAGNVIAILGHNGAGKSTLIKSLLGLLPSYRGNLEATIADGEIETRLAPESDMIFCPENGSVFSDISVESYIKLWCRIKHADANYYKKQGQYYCELLSLAPLFDKLGRELSKGQRRRVQTAIGFLSQPKLLLFDEPFEGLDVQKSHALTEIINSHRNQMSFIISSHRMDVIERLANAVIVLHEGKIVSTGSVADVCSDIAGQSITLTFPEDNEVFIDLLKSKFPQALIVSIGKEITITGKGIDAKSVVTFLNENSQMHALAKVSRPNLIDAMNFHLRTYR